MGSIEVAEFIRESSRMGRLVALADIEAEFSRRDMPVSEGAPAPAQIPSLVQEAVFSHGDIKMIADDSGDARYFSEQFMTGAYAGILLLKIQGPTRMMAQVIREHSRAYPRPVPLALFQCHPFNLSDEETALRLKEMTETPSYQDIAQLTTSIGNLFVYSTDHLEPGHAAMLAEWIDVGQVENP